MSSSSAVRKWAWCAVFVLFFSGLAHAQDQHEGWTHGLGTGMQGLNLEGDVGLGTPLGPVTMELDLDTSEVSDLIETAFGLGGFSSNGTWTLSYSGAYIKLAAGNSGSAPMGVSVSADVTFEVIAAEFTAAYRFAVTGKHAWGVLGGLRYTEHTYESGLEIGMSSLDRTLENNWTDLLVGITHRWSFAKKLAWTNRLDGGIGGSESMVHFNTAINWHLAKHWNLTLSADYRALEFEDQSKGDADWYFYDADEFGLGVSFAFIF